MTNQDREELKLKLEKLKNSDLLPRGYAAIIAKKLDISVNIVYQVISGRSLREDVIAELIKLAKQEKQQKTLLNELDELLG